MKKIKIFIFLCLILLLSGCSVEYDLTLNDDLTVSEKVVATEKTKRMEALTKQKSKQAVNYLYDMFKRNGEDITLTSREDEYNTYATAITSHDDINDYASKFSSDVFDNINVTKDGNIITFSAEQKELLSSDTNYSLLYDDITVNITIPFEVTSNNADKVNGNTYTWNIKKDSDYKTIEFSYKEGNKKDEVNINVNNETYNIHYGVIIVIGFVIIIGSIVLFVYINNKKNNVI